VNVDKQQYSKQVTEKSPKSPIGKNILCAYVIGGLICAFGQGLSSLYLALGLSEALTGPAVSVTMIFLGALFTGLGLYDKLARIAGAGTLVPITGFANAIVSPAMEFKSEGLVPGMSARMFVIAGPVIVFGVTASVLYGLVLLLIGRL
jgi:stage V sporulation protein AC